MSDIVTEIAAVVGEARVLTGRAVAERVTSFWNAAPMQAKAIVLPGTTDEVAEILRLCHARDQTVVTQGGLTNCVTAAEPGSNDIVLSLEKMDRIHEIDAIGGAAVVEAGAILQNVQEAVAAEGLRFPLDLGARGSCTIGGNIATNAGGINVLRYGMMRNLVLGLEAVLADGTVVSSMNRMMKNNAGYDLKQLFIGTEGTLGIVTRAVLRLRPALRSRNTAFVAIDDYANVPRLLKHLGSSLGGSLTAFEVLWEDFYNTVVVERDRHAAPVDAGHPWYVLVEARGGKQEEDAQQFEAALGEALEAGLISDAAFAGGVKQRDAMWAIRDDIDGLAEILDPVMAFDVSLPIAHTADYVAAVKRRLGARWPDTFRGVSFGHLGDNNLHFLLTVGSDDHDEQREAMAIIYDELKPYRGSISAEHGIGLEKRAFLGVTRNDSEVALMRSLKQALDPKGLLNPGRVF